MDDIALAAGNFIMEAFEALGADVFVETIEWIGVATVGYGIIFITVALILLIVFTQRKGRR